MPLKRSAPSRLSTERIWADGRSTSMKRGRKVKEAVAAAALAAVSAAIAAAADPGKGASHAGNGAGVKTGPVFRDRPPIRGGVYGYAIGNHVQEKAKRAGAHGKAARQGRPEIAEENGEPGRFL